MRARSVDSVTLGQPLDVALVAQHLLELEVAVEVVLERSLAAAGDEQDVLEAGGHGLLDDVLDGRLVDDRQHLLGRRLGGRQEPRAEPGRGDDRLADRRLAAHAPTLDDRVGHDGPVTIASRRRGCAPPSGLPGPRAAADDRDAAAEAIAAHAMSLLPPARHRGSIFRVPVPPGRAGNRSAARRSACGRPRVRVPRITGGTCSGSPCSPTPSSTAGPLGIREPRGPALGADELAGLDLMFVPGLAVDRPGVASGRAAATTTASWHRCRRMPTAGRCSSRALRRRGARRGPVRGARLPGRCGRDTRRAHPFRV